MKADVHTLVYTSLQGTLNRKDCPLVWVQAVQQMLKHVDKDWLPFACKSINDLCSNRYSPNVEMCPCTLGDAPGLKLSNKKQ